MKAPDISSLLSEYGIPVSPKTLALLAVALPLLVVFGKKLYPLYQTWAKKRLARAPQADHGAWNAVWRLRSTFRGFLGRLPRVYRRSILNFEHFVVLGAASSGKSTLLDTQTDWLYRTKEVAQDVTVDPELPTYLASGAIITELPGRYLEDTGESSRRALNRLWRPLYRKRSPTVVAVVDTRWLSESTPDARRDLALALRMRVNQLSQLRRRPIEVRVALTRLEEMAGFPQAAKFWVDERISNRVPLPAGSRSEEALEVWLQEMRAQLPRALQRLGASEFHGFIGFLRRIPDLLPPLAHFADVLFQAEPTSLPPIRGGAYLCSAVSGAESPLSNASESGPGPNVLRQHAVLAGVLATTLVLYFAVAYRWENQKWTAAIDEFGKHHVSRNMIAKGPSRVVANGLEEGPRRAIRGFLEDRERFIARFPGFFSRGSDQIREAFLERVREEVLIPQIRKMAEVGAPTDGGTLRSRRAIHGLAILHSDRSDNFDIVANPGLLEWSSKMMQIPEDMIRDYIRSNTTRYVKPLTLAPFQEDEKDTAPYWLALPQEMTNAVGDGVITKEELAQVQRIVERDERTLVRFQNDERTFEELLPKLQSNLGYEDLPEEDKEKLAAEYDRTFRLVSGEYHANLLFQNAEKLRAMMTLVTTSSKVVSGNPPEFLVDLLARLTEAETARRSPLPTHDPIVIELGGRSLSIDARRWHDLVFQLGVERTIDGFIAKRERPSTFFPPVVVERELRDLDWNSLATSGAPFSSRGLVKGSYTRTGYERWVRQPIANLALILDRLGVSTACKGRLAEFLHAEVKAYAREYSREIVDFQDGFRLNASKPTSLGMVLEEMSGPNSIFDEFVAIIDENTDLSYGAELAEAAPPGAAHGTATTADKPSASTVAGPFLPEAILAPLREALAEFDAWHRSVGARGKRAEMTKYKAIIKQLLTDLQAASNSEPSAAPREAEALDKLLPAAGKNALGFLRSDPKSYDALARQWASDTGLTHAQQRPFLAPFDELWRLGRDDLQKTLTDAWEGEMLPLLDSVSSKFPFDRRADAAVEPAELTRLFHPVDGEFSRLVARYVAPLSEEVKDGGWKPSASAVKRVTFPPGLYATVNAVSYLSSRLWDSKGAPRPLTFRVVTVPFDAVAGRRLVPTAVTLKAGAMSVLNVNQKPQTSTLSVDWTGDDSAQLSLRVGDAETGEASYPAPLVANGPHFRFWRLLSLATRVDAERRGGAHLYEWRLRLRDGSDEKAPVHLEILDDPWSLFSIKRGRAPKKQ